MTQEDKKYLKNNLKLAWKYEGDDLYIVLKLEDEVISKIHFGTDEG